MKSSEKEIGIDILRIAATVMVVTLHVLGPGGVYRYAASVIDTYPVNYPLSWYLEVAVYGAVDLFALISGYVGWKSRFRFSKYLKIWSLVAFWGVLFTFLFGTLPFLFDQFAGFLNFLIPSVQITVPPYPISAAEYLKALLPVSHIRYWYFNAYTILFFASPLLNKLIQGLGQKEHFLVCAGIIVLFSILPSLSNTDLFVTGDGYSAFWLIMLYLIGAYLGKYPPQKKPLAPLWCLAGYFLCTTAAWGWCFLIEFLMKRYPANENLAALYGQFVSYTSPFVLLGSLFLVCGARQRKPQSITLKKAVAFATPATFGIYIIHVHPIFWYSYIDNQFWQLGCTVPAGIMFLGILAAVVLLFAVCLALEKLRIWLFHVARIDSLLDVLGGKADQLIKSVTDRLIA